MTYDPRNNFFVDACRLAKHPRTTKEIADMFGIQSRDISKHAVLTTSFTITQSLYAS